MEDKMPDILYKYKPWNDYTKKILTDGELYFPSIGKLNDPFEGSIPYVFDWEELTAENIFIWMYKLAKRSHLDWKEEDIYKYVCEEQKKGRLFDEKHIEEQNRETREEVERLFGIFSLTTKRNNFLMWSHYAYSHTGICIGFDVEKVFDIVQGTLGKVIYQKELPIKHLNDDTIEFINNLLFTKSKDWVYEDEYRIIKINAANSTFKIPLEAIVDITLGCKFPIEDKKEIIAIVKSKIPSCEIYEATLSKTKFELNINKLKPEA